MWGSILDLLKCLEFNVVIVAQSSKYTKTTELYFERVDFMVYELHGYVCTRAYVESWGFKDESTPLPLKKWVVGLGE